MSGARRGTAGLRSCAIWSYSFQSGGRACITKPLYEQHHRRIPYPQPRPAMLYLLSAALHRDYRTYLEDPYTISRCSKYGLKLVCLC